MQQHGSKYFARRPPIPLTRGMGSQGQNSAFQKNVMLHIKLRESQMQQHDRKYVACRSPHRPWGCSQ